MLMYVSVIMACAMIALAQPARAIEVPPSWQVYNVSNSDLPNNLVYRVEVDKLGRAWLSCGGLTLFDGSNWKNFSEFGVLQIGIASDNTVWCACDLFSGSLVHCDGVTATSYNDQNSNIPSNWVTGVTVDNDDRVWAGCSYTGIGELNDTTWTKHLGSQETGGGYVSMAHDKDNTIWAASGIMLHHYSNGAWASMTVPGLDDQSQAIRNILCDHDSSIWLGIDAKGLAHYKGGQWTFYSVESGELPDNMVYATALDSSGVLWVGTAKGLSSFDGTTWETRTKENWVLPDDRVRSIAVGADNSLWVGTERGLLHTAQSVVDVAETDAGSLGLVLSPNPVDGDAVAIRFSLPAPAQTEVEVYALSGERVAVVAAGALPTGDHSYSFDSRRLATGSYYCVVTTAGHRVAHIPFAIRR